MNIKNDPQENKEKDSILSFLYFDTTIIIEQSDITGYSIDCIVNAANKSLMGGGGVDGAIHRAAGKDLLEECRTLNGCNTGEAKLTLGYKLKASFVIHTVGPVWRGGTSNEEMLLKNCYMNSMILATKNGFRQIAFPAISTGIYGYPVEMAAKVAMFTVLGFIRDNETSLKTCIFSCFDDRTLTIYKEIATKYFL
jgi:O-acetyl-ADP-ribose deacetylase